MWLIHDMHDKKCRNITTPMSDLKCSDHPHLQRCYFTELTSHVDTQVIHTAIKTGTQLQCNQVQTKMSFLMSPLSTNTFLQCILHNFPLNRTSYYSTISNMETTIILSKKLISEKKSNQTFLSAGIIYNILKWCLSFL